MADKKSFIMYDTWARLFCGLPDEKAGELIKLICKYILGEYMGEKTSDPAMDAIFDMVREKLDEDKTKYLSICEKRAEARRKKQVKTNDNNCKEMLSNVNKREQFGSDTDTETDTDTDILPKGNINILSVHSPKNPKHKYGEYSNVLLTDSEYDKLKSAFPAEYNKWIDKLSGYIASTGKTYKSHYATILNWSRREKDRPGDGNKFNNFKQNQYDYDELEKQLVSN